VSELERLVVADREVLRLTSDEVALDVVPGLGGTIVSLRRRADDLELLWRTPWGLRRPSAAPIRGSAEANMIDSYPGGWQSIFPNGSDSAVVDGAEWPHDGEARIAWYDWESSGSSVIMKARLLRAPFELTKIISLRGREVTVGETVKNVGTEHSDVVWGQQIALGAPLLGADAVLDSTASVVHADPWTAGSASYDDILPWPRGYGADGVVNLRSVPRDPQTRRSYLCEHAEPRLTVRNPRAGVAVQLEWDEDAWPHVWYELETGAATSWPWFGNGYFLRLTPCSSWPARSVHDVRRVSATSLRVHPGVTRTSHLSVRVD
jgi:hypothetical protein